MIHAQDVPSSCWSCSLSETVQTGALPEGTLALPEGTLALLERTGASPLGGLTT